MAVQRGTVIQRWIIQQTAVGGRSHQQRWVITVASYFVMISLPHLWGFFCLLSYDYLSPSLFHPEIHVFFAFICIYDWYLLYHKE